MTNAKKLEKKIGEIMGKIRELEAEKQGRLSEYNSKVQELEAEKEDLTKTRPEKLTELDTRAVMEIDQRIEDIDKELEIVKEAMEKYKVSSGIQDGEINIFEKELKQIIKAENEIAFNEVKEHIKASLVIYQNYVEIQNRGNEVIKLLEQKRTDLPKVRYTSDSNLYKSGNYGLNINNLMRGNQIDEISNDVLGKTYNKFLETIIYY